MTELTTFVVLYRTDDSFPLDEPFTARFRALDECHAEETMFQILGEDIEIVWVVRTEDLKFAIEDWLKGGRHD